MKNIKTKCLPYLEIRHYEVEPSLLAFAVVDYQTRSVINKENYSKGKIKDYCEIFFPESCIIKEGSRRLKITAQLFMSNFTPNKSRMTS